MKQRFYLVAASALFVLGSSMLCAQADRSATPGTTAASPFHWPPSHWPPPGPPPGTVLPPPASFGTGISASVQQLESVVQYGLSLPDEAPLWLPDGFQSTADDLRSGWTAHARQILAMETAKPTPRLPSGQPDLSGAWRGCGRLGCVVSNGSGASNDFPDPRSQSTADKQAGAVGFATFIRPRNQPVYTSSVDQTTQRDLWYRNVYKDPAYQCTAVGVPRLAAPTFILETANAITFMYSSTSDTNPWRIIPIGGQFKPDAPATPYGQSIGHWEGDTLVVEVRHLDPSTWFGEFGMFHSPNIKVTERYRRVGEILVYQAQVDDPLLAKRYFSTPRYNVTTSIPTEGLPCIQPDNTIRTELYPVPYLPEGNSWN